MIETAPNALEMAVLREICKQLPAQDRTALEEQIDGILVKRRQSTGAGFFTYFTIMSNAMHQIHVDTRGAYVTAKINGLDNALGFILWLKDGYVDYLEGYPMALDHTQSMDFAAVEFELVSAPGIIGQD
jgi:hypothetical protein